jgi:hypothetical protein
LKHCGLQWYFPIHSATLRVNNQSR